MLHKNVCWVCMIRSPHCVWMSCSLSPLVLLQTCRDEGPLSLHLFWGQVPVHRMHPDPGQEPTPGEPRLQLPRLNAEQGVPEEGAMQRWREVPLEARLCGGGCGLHLRHSQRLVEETCGHDTLQRIEVCSILWEVCSVLQCDWWLDVSQQSCWFTLCPTCSLRGAWPGHTCRHSWRPRDNLPAHVYGPIYCHSDDIIIDGLWVFCRSF